MERWMIISLVALGAFIVSLFFEEARDYYMDALNYIISFDWMSDIGDFLGSAFEGLSDFSFYGLSFALLATGLIFFTRSYMIEPFVQYYDPFQRMFWTIATYVAVFIAGYLLGKAFENTS